MLKETALLHQSFGPHVLLSLCLSLCVFLSHSLSFQADPLELRGPLGSLSCLGF